MDTNIAAKVLLYGVDDIERDGVQAVGTFHGVPRQGWIMNGKDFVDYAGFAQLVLAVADGTDVKRKIWHPSSATSADMVWHHRQKEIAAQASGNPEIDAALRAGFQVEQGTVEDGPTLDGRWWWTLSRPSWSGVESSPGEFETEAEAWSDAVRLHKADPELAAHPLPDHASSTSFDQSPSR